MLPIMTYAIQTGRNAVSEAWLSFSFQYNFIYFRIKFILNAEFPVGYPQLNITALFGMHTLNYTNFFH